MSIVEAKKPKPRVRMRRKYKMKIETYPMRKADRDEFAKLHILREELKVASRGARTPEVREFFKKKLKDLKESIKNDYCPKFWNIKMNVGGIEYEIEDMLPHVPKREDLINAREELFKKVQRVRSERKEFNYSQRTFAGFNYTTMDSEEEDNSPEETPVPLSQEQVEPVVAKKEDTREWMIPSFKGARCFREPGSITKMMNVDNYARRIRNYKKPYDKSNYVGVELELVCRIGQEPLEKLLIEKKLSGNVMVVHDGSLRADPDHYSPGFNGHCHEITIIAKQQNIAEVIDRVCSVLNSPEVDAYVNDTCGMHTHLDMRNRDPKICYKNLVRSLPVLASMVPANRTKGPGGLQYCKMNEDDEFVVSGSRNDRYRAVNPESYKKHKTLEVRLHSGTTNANKIKNWVSILCSIVDKSEVVKVDKVEHCEMFKECFGLNDSLIAYMKARTKKFSEDQSINNKQDNLDLAV